MVEAKPAAPGGTGGPPDARFEALGAAVTSPTEAPAPGSVLDRDTLIQSLGSLVRLPFIVWARVAKDPEINLTKEEARGGIQSGYALVQALGTTFNPLWFAAAVFAGWGASVTIPRVLKKSGQREGHAGKPEAAAEGSASVSPPAGTPEGSPNWESMK